MQFSTPLILALMVWLVRAQTPAGFTPRVNTKLEVDFNATAVKTAGQELEKARTFPIMVSQPILAKLHRNCKPATNCACKHPGQSE